MLKMIILVCKEEFMIVFLKVAVREMNLVMASRQTSTVVTLGPKRTPR